MYHTSTIFIVISIFIILSFFLFPISDISSNDYASGIILFQESGNGDDKIKDIKNDTKLVTLYKTSIIPEIRDYHDILSAEVNKPDNNKFLFTIELSGDANKK